MRPAAARALDLRVPVDLRLLDVPLRAVARPPLRPAATTDGALRVVDLLPELLRAVDFLRVVVLLRPVVLRAVARPPLRPAATRAADFLPVLLRVVDLLRVPVLLRPVVLRAVDLRPVVLRAVARPPLRPAATTDGALRVVDFLRPVLFRVVAFLRVPVLLRAVLLRPVVLRAVARPPLRPAAARALDLRVPLLLREVVFLPLPVLLRVVVFFRPVLLRRTGLRVERPESAPKTSEAAPAAPVSMVRVAGAKSSSEPEMTTPPSSMSPAIG